MYYEAYYYRTDDQLPCPVCGKAFRSQAHLQDHVKRHGRLEILRVRRLRPEVHRQVIAQDSQARPLRNQAIQVQGVREELLAAQHARPPHADPLGEKPFPCPICPKEFAPKSTLTYSGLWREVEAISI
ncbi:hypothetical protein NQ318_016115 [Aromia moschata]|uniref:C2H2-type domain-containing protein n=1 Tax=Aromia moschata TaxID=1265417 RepID=A0AAV8XE41_9CUCU|nr:hypothetical protein NQ318_016115 [Aromia moschata]